MYSGRQINELYAIVPLCTKCHRGENGTINADIRGRTKLHAISEGLEHLEANYPKHNWRQELSYLKKKYVLEL